MDMDSNTLVIYQPFESRNGLLLDSSNTCAALPRSSRQATKMVLLCGRHKDAFLFCGGRNASLLCHRSRDFSRGDKW